MVFLPFDGTWLVIRGGGGVERRVQKTNAWPGRHLDMALMSSFHSHLHTPSPILVHSTYKANGLGIFYPLRPQGPQYS